MACRLVLIRHGLTYWNERRKMQGQVNIPLSPAGRRQAKELRRQIEGYPFEVCYASPLDRAQETARIALGESDVPIVVDNRLVEQGYGLYESSSYRRTPRFYLGSQQYNYQNRPDRYVPTIGGETFDQLCARARSFIDDVILPESRRRDCFLVAAHCAINCAILNTFFDIPVERFWELRQGNCGYTALLLGDDGDVTIERRSPTERE